MKNNKFQLTNPIPYKIDMLIRGLNVSVKIENPNGLNHQKILINFKILIKKNLSGLALLTI